MSSEDLALFIVRSRLQLLARWRTCVHQEPNQGAVRLEISDATLDDHLPSLLDKLADAIRGRTTADVEPEGIAHGHQRRMLGYTVREILWEFRLLRQIIMEATREQQRVQYSGTSEAEFEEAQDRILDIIDRSIAASVESYVKETEDERNASTTRLEERTKELEQRTASLEEADRQKNHFLAILSHELRNPLSAIVSSAHLLSRADLPGPFGRARDIVARQARHQIRLLDDLLEVNRIATGKVQLQKVGIDFRDAVRQAIESCAAAIDAKKLRLDVTLPEVPVLIHADPARMVQIVTNLLTNAVKFTGPEGALSLNVQADDQQVILRLEDHGIGISPEMLPRIFEMFAQADTSLERTSGGLGVGLYLVKHLIELHGGQVEALSQGLHTGATFIVRLPSLRRDQRPALASVPKSPRVGIVEDNADSRVVLADILEGMGFTVLTAEDGEEGVRLAEQERLDAYIIDIGLPRMDGFEVARRIRQMPAADRALLIALSGYGNADDKDRAAAAGFDHHMTKPADFEVLERLLRSVG